MKVFITGASGFLGKYILDECIKRGYETTVFTHENAFQHENKIVKMVYGDITNYKDVSESLENDYDIIFHLAGIYGLGNKNKIYNVNFNGTKNLLEAIKYKKINIKRLVFMSSVAAMGPTKSSRPLNESTICKPNDIYGLTKYRAEILVRFFSENNGIDYTIIRSSKIYGPRNDKASLRNLIGVIKLNNITALVNKLGICPIFDCTKSLVYIKNLVDGIFIATNKNSGANNTFIVTDGRDYSYKEIAETLSKIIDKNIMYLKLPIDFLKFVSFFEKAYSFDLNSVRFSIDKIRKIGYRPKYTLYEGLKETMNWHKNISMKKSN